MLPHPFGTEQAGAPTRFVQRDDHWEVVEAGDPVGLTNEGWWGTTGSAPSAAAWTVEGGLVRCRLSGGDGPAVALAGRVHDAWGRSGGAEVVGCGGWTRADAEGRFVLPVRVGARCALWGRTDGRRRWGGATWVVPAGPLAELVVSTTPPEVPSALHADVAVEGAGLRVVSTSSGASLLEVGDLLWSIDGRPLGPQPLAVLAAALGGAGPHRIEVERGGARRELRTCATTVDAAGACGVPPALVP